MAKELLKRYINEVLKVTVDRNGKTYVKTLEDDDQADEFEWLLKKYERNPAWTLKSRAKSELETAKAVKEEDVRQLGLKLDYFVKKPDEVGHLMKMIEPWGSVGFDALTRIHITEQRTGKSFPFLSYKPELKPSPGKSDPLPNEPSVNLIEFLVHTNTRIGSNVTGNGEFLLSLLTGGISGGNLGDIVIDGKIWEVKNAGDGSNVRLGGKASIAFNTFLEEKMEEMKENGMTSMPLKVLRSKLSSADYYASLSVEDPIRKLINEATAHVLDEFGASEETDESSSAASIHGYVILSKKTFYYKAATDATFYNLASGRLQVTFNLGAKSSDA